MFNRFFGLGFKSNTIKKGSRMLSYSAQGSSTILDPNSPSLLVQGSKVDFDQEEYEREEEEDERNYNSKQNSSPHLRYAIVAAILALGSKMDEYGHCLFNFGVSSDLRSLDRKVENPKK